jgi:hypothetical protein
VDNAFFQLRDFNISTSGDTVRQEPYVELQSQGKAFDTTSIRRQLLTTQYNATFEQRGVLNLSGGEILNDIARRRSKWKPGNSQELLVDIFNISTFPWLIESIFPLSISRTYCTYRFRHWDTGGHNDILQSRIFHDILEETGSPALALQGHLTILLSMAYYNWLPLFDASSNASMSVFISRLAPVSTSGYQTVIGIIASHTIVCSIITIMFLRKTKYSSVGNTWSVSAQVVNAEQAQIILQDSTLKSDKEIKKELKGADNLRKRYRIALTDDGEGATIAPVPNKEDLK